MNTDTHSYREKGRAVFLAAIMVLSMVAGVAAFGAAPAAAQTPGEDITTTDPKHYVEPSNGTGVIELSFSEQIDQFDTLNVTVGGVGGEINVSSGIRSTGTSNVVVDLTNVAGVDDVQPRVDEVIYNASTDGGGNFTGEQSRNVQFIAQALDDTDNSGVNIFEGAAIGIVNSTAESYEITSENEFQTRGAAENSTIAVLDTDAEDFSLEEYAVNSEGGSFTANFTLRDLGLETSLDETEITTADNVTGTATTVDQNRPMLAELVQDGDVVADTTFNLDENTVGSYDLGQRDTGNYTVRVTDLNTGADIESDTISVSPAPEGDVAFASPTNRIPAGDLGTVTVEFAGEVSEVEVEIGINTDDYGFNFTATDGDNDGEATFRINTYTMNDTDGDTSDVSDIAGDIVEGVGDDEVSTDASQGNIQSAADRLGNELQLRMQATDEASGETDIAVLDLTTRESQSLTGHVAPAGALDDLDFANPNSSVIDEFIQDVQTPRTEVAEGDVFVFLLQANGISGYIQDASDLSGTEGVEFAIAEADAGLDGLTTVDPTDSSVDVAFDQGNDRIVVAVDTSNTTVQANAPLDASFTIDGADNPYVADSGSGPEEELTSELDVVAPNSEFDIVTGDTYTVVPQDGAEVVGSTNVAPGTQFSVSASGDFFVSDDTVEVTDNGTFTAELDFESETGSLDTDQEFTLEGSLAGLSDATGVFGDSPETDAVTPTAQLEEENANLREELETARQERDSAQEELETVRQERDSAQEQVTELENELAQADEDISELQGNLSTAENNLQTVLDALGVDSVDAAVDEIDSLQSGDAGGDSGDSDGGGPGFGIAAALVALIGAALLAVRRRE